ncbi:hypothetical protein E4656_03375 [Natronospirillum operosum]|uniref:Guanidinium exporter n=1 Tax=Natronospirillum operosum TaxID=2759953 RepID=A0A4Z0WD24_9GAMM|nr:SMR family transporter [Natronospirillum operosum]TGG96062.1 hypothetical protein E4656_03375 [Natronospirillum operosum]
MQARAEREPGPSCWRLVCALRKLPVGTAYAVWVGIGAVGVAAVGMIFFRERVSAGRLISLGLIVAGVGGLKLIGG